MKINAKIYTTNKTNAVETSNQIVITDKIILEEKVEDKETDRHH